MTTYAGYDLLLIEPNAVTARGDQVSRVVEGFAIPTGNVVTTTTAAPPASSFTVDWNCATRADLTGLRAFLDARVGQLVPCWIPSYQPDIEVLSVVFGGSWVATQRTGLGDLDALIAANPKAWRYYITRLPDRRYSTHDRITVTDNGDGTVTMAAAIGGPASVGSAPSGTTSAGGGIFSRLLFCRMASDSYRVRVLGQASTVSAEFVEIAAQAP